MSAHAQISLVVPVYDEEENLRPLHAEIAAAMGELGRPWEVVYVDDRSRDQSLAVLLELWRSDPHVRVVRFRANAGQTAAMAAGFEEARGDIVVTLDADLQNDPADIPRLVAELEKGYDVVAGWRKARRDGFVLRKLPSKAANRLIAWSTGVAIHDTGCTLKAFRRELVKNLPIYAEQHRFLPAMATGSGARVAEIVVHHRPRLFGRSKYGIGRATRVLLDLFTVKLIASFSHRPMQYFGLMALPFVVALAGFVAAIVVARDHVSLDNNWGRAATISFVLLFMVGAFYVMLGFLAELAVGSSGLHKRRAGRILARAWEPR